MRRPITRLGAVLLLAAASPLGAQAPAASPAPSPSPAGARQGPPPVTFAVEVGYVEVDAIVTDRNDQPVRDLTREDFTVLEDGKPQTIDLFSRSTSPTSGRSRSRPPPSPST